MYDVYSSKESSEVFFNYPDINGRLTVILWYILPGTFHFALEGLASIRKLGASGAH
jgi:hypothetical protein